MAATPVPGVPVFKAWKTIKRGNHTSASASRGALAVARCHISDWGSDIHGKANFDSQETELSLVVVSNADLGYPNGTTRQKTYDRALEVGLARVPHWTGPAVREEYRDQPLDELLLIGMEPIVDSGGYPSLFLVEHHDIGLWLAGEDGHPGKFWPGGVLWVFGLRRK